MRHFDDRDAMFERLQTMNLLDSSEYTKEPNEGDQDKKDLEDWVTIKVVDKKPMN